jgi:hypothetical protein
VGWAVLGETVLSAALADVFGGRSTDPLATGGSAGWPASAEDAGRRWGCAYRQYAQRAEAGGTVPTGGSLSAAEARLGAGLGAAFAAAQAVGSWDAVPVLASAMDAAFVSFWAGPPAVVWEGGGLAPPVLAGVADAVPSGTMTEDLAGVLAAGHETAGAAASALARVLHAWVMTITVVVAEDPPDGPVRGPASVA